MLAHEAAVGATDAAREVLDRFGITGRLQHIGQYVWRGGTLRLHVTEEDGRPPSVSYELSARWPAPVFERLPSSERALKRAASPVLEGRWMRGTAGYVLRIGLDLAVPSAIFIRSDRPFSNVPFLQRPFALVDHALAIDLSTYVQWFLDTRATVPQASQAAARRLREYGLVET